MHFKKKWHLALLLGLIAAVTLGVVACAPQTTTPAAKAAPEPNAQGLITAEMWKDTYPNEYATFEMTSENVDKPSYLDSDPYLKTLYEGMAFAKDYSEARGHAYTLEDIGETKRISDKSLANCLTCKSSYFTALVNTEGVEVYKRPFADVLPLLEEPISCYNCHGNTGDQLEIESGYLATSLGADTSKIDMKNAACGQCHNEYYFDPDTKAVTLPWNGLSTMTPDAMLAWENNINYVDFTNPRTTIGMLKVQHPELETVMGEGNLMDKMGGLTCADCHMGTTEDSSGKEFSSHNLVSPLENKELLDSKCNTCHNGKTAEALDTLVPKIQQQVTSREKEIGAKYADLTNKLADIVASGSKSADEIQAIGKLLRDGQFYFDFSYVENSEGAHNSALAKSLLDKADTYYNQAVALL